jgi:hypothetical protein
MKRSELYPRRFFSADDFSPQGQIYTIGKITSEKVGTNQETKNVVYFINCDKQWIMNITCFDLIADFLGGDTADWPGKKVQLFPTTTTLGGKPVACIRVKRPRPSAPAQATPPAPPPKGAAEDGQTPMPPYDDDDPGYDPLN